MNDEKPAIFLDRDGTINIDNGYVHKIKNFKFIDGIIETLQEFIKMQFKLILVTNQSGIARGIFKKEEFIKLTKWMNLTLSKSNIKFDAIYYCPHHQNGKLEKYRKNCNFRKPKSGMFLAAKKKFKIDMLNSYMIGDKIEDIQAAKLAGIKNKILVKSGKIILKKHTNTENFVLNNLTELPKYILKKIF